MKLDPDKGVQAFKSFDRHIIPISNRELEENNRIISRYNKNPNLVNINDYPDLLPYFEELPQDTHYTMLSEIRRNLPKVRNENLKYSGIDNLKFRKLLSQVGGTEAITIAINNIMPTDVASLSNGFNKLNYIRLLKNITRIGEGAYGEVYSACLQCDDNKTDMIIKISTSNNNDFLLETFIGFVYINKLNRVSPNFITTYGFNNCRDIRCTEKNNYISTLILEKVNGTRLESTKLTESQIVNIIFQIFLSLQIAYSHCKYTHYDLHAGNIMIEKLPHKKHLPFYIGNYYIELKSDVLVRIIDYGFSSVQDKFGIDGKYRHQFGITHHSNPTYDAFKLLSDIYNLFKLPWLLRMIERVVSDPNTNNITNFPAMYDMDYLFWLSALVNDAPTEKLELNIEYEYKAMDKKLRDVMYDIRSPSPETLAVDLYSTPDLTNPFNLLYYIEEYQSGVKSLKSIIDKSINQVNLDISIEDLRTKLDMVNSAIEKLTFSPEERRRIEYIDRKNFHRYKFKKADLGFKRRIRKLTKLERDRRLIKADLNRLNRLSNYITKV